MTSQEKINSMTEGQKSQISMLVSSVLQKAMEVNFKTSFCAFIRVSAHCNNLEIEVRASKSNFHKELYTGHLSYDAGCFSTTGEIFPVVEEKFKKVNRELDHFLSSKEICEWKVQFKNELITVDETFKTQDLANRHCAKIAEVYKIEILPEKITFNEQPNKEQPCN